MITPDWDKKIVFSPDVLTQNTVQPLGEQRFLFEEDHRVTRRGSFVHIEPLNSPSAQFVT